MTTTPEMIRDAAMPLDAAIESFQQQFNDDYLTAKMNTAGKLGPCEVQVKLDGTPGGCTNRAVFRRAHAEECPECGKHKTEVEVAMCIPHAIDHFGRRKPVPSPQIDMFDAAIAEKSREFEVRKPASVTSDPYQNAITGTSIYPEMTLRAAGSDGLCVCGFVIGESELEHTPKHREFIDDVRGAADAPDTIEARQILADAVAIWKVERDAVAAAAGNPVQTPDEVRAAAEAAERIQNAAAAGELDDDNGDISAANAEAAAALVDETQGGKVTPIGKSRKRKLVQA